MFSKSRIFPLIPFFILSFTFKSDLTLAAYPAPTWSRGSGMAATPHIEATNAANEVLLSGGNALDAALAAVFALAVVEQYHSGLGGGEFIIYRDNKTGNSVALDAREIAPKEAASDMFIDRDTGKPFEDKSWRGGLAVGVPGSVAGRVLVHEKYGRLSLKQVLAPAVKLASDGFIVDRMMANRLNGKRDVIAEDEAASKVFFRNNEPVQRGELLRQPNLAKTLSTIASDKGKSFYHGEQAKYIAKSCQKSGGILTEVDMSEYKPVWRNPVCFSYRNCEIISMPPPTSGGVCLNMILKLLEDFPLSYTGSGSSESLHLIASAFEIAFADRSVWLGDPDFSIIPSSGMTSDKYNEKLKKKINKQHREAIDKPGDPWQYVTDGNTSHVSVIDAEGNMCSITTSVNTTFGSLVYVPELGIFLNSTMDDFAKAPSEPNKFDLVAGEVNLAEPGKRPLSSMSPTLVLKDNQPYMCIGSVGGPRIITSVAQIIINVVDFGMDVQAAIDAPRIHMQWKPDILYVEDEIAPEVLQKLRDFGWSIKRDGHWSLSQGVLFDPLKDEFFGASDSRGVGSAGAGGK